MKYLINKNFLKKIAKSMDNEADSFRKIKAEILDHLRNIEKKENNELKKASEHICEQEHLFGYLEKSDSGEWVEKSGFGVGTVRTWRGKKYKKISVKPNRWVRVYDKADRGAKNAITRLIHSAEQIESPEEMMQFVLANKQRFIDANGKPLDIVDRLQKVIDAKNTEYDSKAGTKENKKNNDGNSQNAKKLFSDLEDSEKIQKANQIKNNVVASVKPDSVPYDENKSVAALAKEWVENNPQGDANTVIGDVIINEKSAVHDLHHGAKEDSYLKLQTLPAIKDILEKGTYLGYEKDYDGKPIDNHYFAGKIKYGDEEKIVFCRVRENAGDVNRFYVHEVFTEDELKKEAATRTSNPSSLRLTGKPLYQYILQDVLNVNEKKDKAEEKASEDYDKLYARLTYRYLSDILEKGHKQTVENPELGEISIEAGETGKSGWGLKHIIEQRYRNDGKNADDIAALIPLVIGAAKDGKLNRENKKLYELEKNGIVAIVRKESNDRKSKWILTGFENWDKPKEAADSIKTVIAKYGYAPEYSSFRKQVGAVIASIENPADAVKTGNAKYGYAPEYSHFRKQAGAAVASTDNVSRKGGKVKKSLKDIRNHYESSKSITGNKKTIYAGDEKIKGHWKLVEADAPMASHDEKTFAKTDGFPESKNGGTINDRDYEHDKDAQESVRDIAANFNGRALDMGEPVIVTKDGIVISGNNRTMSSKLAAKNGTDKQYLSDLREQVEDFGFDEEDLDGFKHPRIVFEIDNEHEGDYTTEEFAKFNKTGKKAKNATEKAVEISKTIKSESVKNVADVISGYDTMGEMWADRDASRKIMNSFVENGVIGKNDMAQYYTEEGGMSAAGKEFVETCLIGSIMNETNIRTLSGDGGKAIRQKLVRAIVPLIENKGDGNEYSFNNELNESVRIASFVAKNHSTYPTIKTYFDQQDMFESEANPIVKKLAELIHDNTQKEFAEQMKNLEAGIRPNAAGEMDIFLGECETRNSVITRILRIKDTVRKSISTTFDYVQKSIENLKKCRAI